MKSFLMLLALVGQLPDSLPEDSPTESPVGQLVVLDASIIPSKARSWLLVNPPPDDRHIVLSDGRLIFSTGMPGVYRFVLAFTPEGEDEDGIHQILHTLKIGNGVSPSPNPNPGPEPILPDGKFGLSKLVRTEGLKVSDKSSAGKVANIYRSIATLIIQGNLKSREGKFGESINKATSEMIGSLLSEKEINLWKPVGMAIGVRINELQKAGEFKTDSDYVSAYTEIAIGLDSLKERRDDRQPEPSPQRKVGWVIIVEETNSRTPEQTRVLSDLNFWNSLGLKWRMYDDDSEDSKQYLPLINQDDLPQVLLLEEDGTFIKSFKLPESKNTLKMEMGLEL